MLKRKLGFFAAALTAVMMLASCVVVDGTGTGTTTGNGIDYADYTKNGYSILVKNETSTNLVAFKGAPSAGVVLGGVKGNSLTGLKKNTAAFNNSQDFVLYFVSEEEYLKNRNNLALLDTQPFARMYAYYNENAENNKTVYTVSEMLGGDYYFTLNNMTGYNVELRLDSVNGIPIGYAGKQTILTTFYVGAGNYQVFPVFRKYDSNSGEIITVYPKTNKGNPVMIPFTLGDGPSMLKSMEFDAEDWVPKNGFTFAHSASYLKIVNNSKVPGIALYPGANATAYMTSTGGMYIATGKALTYTIDMDILSTDDTTGEKEYAPQSTISGYKVGTPAGKVDIPEHIYEAGKMYTLLVTGDSYDDLQVKWEVDKFGEEVVSDVNF